MYNKILIPLDGSKTAEKVLPYARHLAGKINASVELLAVVDIAEMATHISRGEGALSRRHDRKRYAQQRDLFARHCRDVSWQYRLIARLKRAEPKRRSSKKARPTKEC